MPNMRRKTGQALELLRIFQHGPGTWMDVMDHAMNFQREVVKGAFSSQLLQCAICALSAKHMSFIAEKFVWDPVASSYYGESLKLLIKEISQPYISHDILLAATILLSSYELLSNLSPDHEKHLFGARTIMQAGDLKKNESSLYRASFWVYARQDVALALVNECPTLTPTCDWDTMLPGDGIGEDTTANRMLCLLARVINLKFTTASTMGSTGQGQKLTKVSVDIDHWWDNLALTSRGVIVGDRSADGLSQTWFCAPAAAAGFLYYHLASILLIETTQRYHHSVEPLVEIPGSPEHQSVLKNKLFFHAQSIASACLTGFLPDGVQFIAVNPLFYAARYIRSLALKTKLWAMLNGIEARLGFHTKSRVAQSQLEAQQFHGTDV
ncbi:hypothetical protein BKA67DRAFT_595785 [Truncatella angustata]|uniref:Uncharacterized protein n=1 Tax=Truncatella angustata TaxID=152316 RepID=A0A9P8RGL6_9PEZI|nr:uncharacterized protein BKA67DRAFT_595785 [Truncatella angustata]KAH6645434.1 hypothetical protein BKA67DRAFT_595785 [Truncatella angustata]